MDNIEIVKELRNNISKQLRFVRLLIICLKSADNVKPAVINYLIAAEMQLALAFSWLGELLGKLNEKTPYQLGGDVTTRKVEPTSDWYSGEIPEITDPVIFIKEVRKNIKDINENVNLQWSDTNYANEINNCHNCLIQAKNLMGFTFPFLAEVVKEN